VKRTVIVVCCFLLVLLAGCGGAGKSSTPPPTTPAPTSTSTAPPTSSSNVVGSPPGTQVILNVAAGQAQGGVDITVPAARAATPPNAQLLGTGPVTGSISASNTGATVHPGETVRVLIFGPGLDVNTTISITGPQPPDIVISGLRATSSTAGNPGITFIAEVAPTAALGARTVIFQNAQGDVSTFTGGLEVIP
jgi:hypothetical protein